MTTLTLLARAHNTSQLNQVGDALNLSLEGLEVEAKILGTAAGKWVQIDLTGEDETIATNYIAKEIGFCPANFDEVKKHSTLKGYITDFGKNKEELTIDIGVFQPKNVHTAISLHSLQDQLVIGRSVALKEIGKLFGFCNGLPLTIKVTDLNEEPHTIKPELSAWQVEKYEVWKKTLLDRLIVLGVATREVNNALEYAKLNRDVINVEPLGMFEHALACKLGTDAAGLIPKIGRILRNAKFAVFNPRRLLRFLDS